MSLLGNSPEARDVARVLHPYTNLSKHQEIGPLVLAEGKGVWVTDIHGKRYLEGMAGLWCTGLGYGEERLAHVAAEQMKTLAYTHLFAHKSHMPAIELAEKLCELAPLAGTARGMAKAFFANSGSEANDTAVKIVWYYHNAIGKPLKKKIIARQRGYHGVTVAAASLTGLTALHTDFDLPLAGILHTSCPHYYRGARDGETEEQFSLRLATELEELILKEGPETIGAFIAEPLQGAGGVILPPKSYFAAIQPVLRRYDILLIADEVICGFGRTGAMFGSETYGIEPDIMTMAKQLTSAYFPLSAVLINQTIADTVTKNAGKIGTFGTGYTYSGHPVGCAIALEVLKIYEERHLLEHTRRMSAKFISGFRRFADHPLVGEVRAVGLIAACELVKDKASKQSYDASLTVAARMAKHAEELGLVVRPLIGDAVAVCPPLIINDEELAYLLERYEQALDRTLKSLG